MSSSVIATFSLRRLSPLLVFVLPSRLRSDGRSEAAGAFSRTGVAGGDGGAGSGGTPVCERWGHNKSVSKIEVNSQDSVTGHIVTGHRDASHSDDIEVKAFRR